MLVESAGELDAELEKQAQPQTGTLGLSGASSGKEGAASLLLRPLELAQARTALGRGGGVVDNSAATFLLPLRRTAPGFHSMKTARWSRLCYKGTSRCKKKGAVDPRSLTIEFLAPRVTGGPLHNHSE